jgi:HD superfamily phosphohydrolase
MRRERGKLYQDPIYGAKVLTPLAVAIVDTPELQRLAGLRQLGFSDLVYRGAVHTRLQHSIGTYFACRTMLRRIVQNHERLGLEHPGKSVSARFRQVPSNSDLPDGVTTYQSKWRGVTEVVSAAALLHDIGHVAFGHTLEDEYSGIYPRHDSLAGPRLYEMLFSESSDLAKVFSDTTEPWLQGIANSEIRQLVYLILSWKDDIDAPCGFDSVLTRAKAKANDGARGRLEELSDWYVKFHDSGLFQPFMTDVVGNTICADLLDYLPRDRQHLGMEPRLHTRLQRYLTIRQGTLYQNEGQRVSIMVTRKGQGGQRRDVATAVLDIMRERYEMSERVYYHHKKAAASAMLVKLVELVGSGLKPRDDERIYPAPWTPGAERTGVPHMAHLSDQEFIDYLGSASIKENVTRALQRQLHAALRYRRADIYRTLLVVDTSLADASSHSISYIAKELRGDKDNPSSEGRLILEAKLEQAAGGDPGEVLIYCPSPSMQSKVVDARLEIKEGRVLPLRIQTESFAYRGDLEVLEQYYSELWRAYVFVSPRLFEDSAKCNAVVDAFCVHFGIPTEVAYRKVRMHEFAPTKDSAIESGFETVNQFIRDLPIEGVPSGLIAEFLHEIGQDKQFATLLAGGSDPSQRLSALLQVSTLRVALATSEKVKRMKKADISRIERYCDSLLSGERPYQVAAREGRSDYGGFVENLIEGVLSGRAGPSLVQ